MIKFSNKLRNEIIQEDYSPLALPYYEGKEIIENSRLYQAFINMPKGGHLHFHVDGGFPMELILNLTRKDNAYYNYKHNFLSSLSANDEKEGYERCNDLRTIGPKSSFDEFLKEQILLTAQDISSQNSNKIWKIFESKFSFIKRLFLNLDNLKLGILEICKRALKDGVYIVELRKSSFSLHPDLDKEMEVFQSVLDEMKIIDPDFELTLIITSVKSSDIAVKQQLKNYNYLRNKYSFVSGFDLIGEEDRMPSIYHYKDLILEAQKESEK